MTDLCGAVEPARASARKMSASVRFKAPKERAPILRKLRRETPSQKRFGWPKIVSMVRQPLSSGGRSGRPNSGPSVAGGGGAQAGFPTDYARAGGGECQAPKS